VSYFTLATFARSSSGDPSLRGTDRSNPSSSCGGSDELRSRVTRPSFRRRLMSEIGITTGSLDNPNLVPPRVNIYTGSRLEWVVPDGLPEYRGGSRQG